jgi:hypothetical protein
MTRKELESSKHKEEKESKADFMTPTYPKTRSSLGLRTPVKRHPVWKTQ